MHRAATLTSSLQTLAQIKQEQQAEQDAAAAKAAAKKQAASASKAPALAAEEKARQKVGEREGWRSYRRAGQGTRVPCKASEVLTASGRALGKPPEKLG